MAKPLHAASKTPAPPVKTPRSPIKPGLVLKPRLDRFFPLREAVSYADSPFLDMVLWMPPGGEKKPATLRLWLKSQARSPEIEINRRRFTPTRRSRQDRTWFDFGTITEDAENLGVPGFSLVRLFGLTPDEARDSWLVITRQTSVKLRGNIAEVETALGGIARRDVGRTAIRPCRAPVGSATAFDMDYHTGPRGLPPGSLVRLSFPKAFSMPQVDRPRKPGFLSVGAEKTPVEVVSIAPSIESHERHDVICRLPRGLPPHGRLSCSYRTEFTYLFPGQWSAMDRRYWWSHLPPLAVAVAVDERQVFMPPLDENGHVFETIAREPSRLHLFLPGRIRTDCDIELTGLFTDRYRNIPSRGPVASDLRLRLTGPRTVALGSLARHFNAWYRFRLPLPRLKPGVYRVEALARRRGAVLAVSNPMEVLPAGSRKPAIYWGEIHGHSEQSDGSGGFNEMFRHARDEARLDFAAAGDHACYFTDNDWQWMQDVVNAFNRNGRFTTLIGYEWAGQQGHRNIYTEGNRLDLFRGMSPGTRRLDTVYHHFHGRCDVVAGPHTGHTIDFFAFHDPGIQRFLEIYSMWGAFEELAFAALARGAQIGFTGGGDCHEGRCGFSVEDRDHQGKTPHTFAPGLRYKCGLTAALMPALNRKELLTALRERRTYATTGARILVDFSVSGIPMGGEGTLAGKARVRASVCACGPIASLEVIRNGRVINAIHPDLWDVKVDWMDGSVTPGKHWYLLKVVQCDGETAWTSPVWVNSK